MPMRTEIIGSTACLAELCGEHRVGEDKHGVADRARPLPRREVGDALRESVLLDVAREAPFREIAALPADGSELGC